MSGGVGELVFNGDRDSVWKDEKVLETDAGDSRTLRMYLIPLSCIPKNG